MHIEIGAPAVLPIGLVRFEANICLLGITLQHPPVHLFAEASPKLKVTGPRADVAHQQAQQMLQTVPNSAEIEIELAIPAYMGLGSETALGLSIARALTWVNGSLPENSPAALGLLNQTAPTSLNAIGFEQGGLLLVDAQNSSTQPLKRLEISHPEKDAWAFVFLLPPAPDEVSETLEMDLLTDLISCAPHLSEESGQLVTQVLWPAVQQDDLAAFGEGLQALQQLNEVARSVAGNLHPFGEEEVAIFDLMRANGAVAWGRSPTGLGLYGLIRGGQASRTLRTELRRQVGYFGGTILASVTDNIGARHTVREETLARKLPRPYL